MNDSLYLGRYATTLTAIEIGLGSLLHSLHIPFSGNFLSLNQGFWLSHAVLKHNRERGIRTFPARVSSISSVLKSFSPSGKRLTPMLAIAAQGLCFSLGTISLGPNLFGVVFGMFFLCLWPFVQPILISYLLFGQTWIDAAVFAINQIQNSLHLTNAQLVSALITLIVLKLSLGLFVVLLSRFLSERSISRISAKLTQLSRPIPPTNNVSVSLAFRGALKDLINPFFGFSILMTFFFFYFSESSRSALLWALMRPIGLGFLLFFGFRLFPIRWMPRSLRTTLERLAK